MPTTIQNANLTIGITEAISLNGQTWNGETKKVIPNINEYSKRVVTAPASQEVYLIKFASTPGPGQYKASDVKYIRITNLDDTNFLSIKVTDDTTSTMVFFIKLLPGQFFILSNTSLFASGTGASFTSFATASGIAVTADTAAIDVEIAVASN